MTHPWGALLALTGFVLMHRGAHASPDEFGQERSNRVGVMTFVVAERFGVEDRMFGLARDDEGASLERWQDELASRLEALDLVSVEGAKQLDSSLRAATDPWSFERANSLFESGLGFWKNLEAGRAMTDLDAARALFERGLGLLSSSERLADIEFHRGLALLDLGDEPSAREAFERMFIHAPSKRFERGYYGKDVERVLVDASHRLATIDFIRYRFPAEQLTALAKRMHLDAVAIGVAWPAPERSQDARGAELELAIFDVKSSEFAARRKINLSLPELAEEDLDRLLSSWVTCFIERPQNLARPRSLRRLFLDLAYTHGVWLTHRRTRNFLHGPGAQLSLTYGLKPGLEFWARTSQRSTLRDSNGDLLDVFATTHLAAGIGLDVGDKTWRFLLRAGVDGALSLADIAMTTDVDCKFFGSESPRCRSIFKASSPAFWLGLDFSLGLRFAPRRSWYGTLQVGMTGYVVSPQVTDELNFPLYGALGFGLPF